MANAKPAPKSRLGSAEQPPLVPRCPLAGRLSFARLSSRHRPLEHGSCSDSKRPCKLTYPFSPAQYLCSVILMISQPYLSEIGAQHVISDHNLFHSHSFSNRKDNLRSSPRQALARIPSGKTGKMAANQALPDDCLFPRRYGDFDHNGQDIRSRLPTRGVTKTVQAHTRTRELDCSTVSEHELATDPESLHPTSGRWKTTKQPRLVTFAGSTLPGRPEVLPRPFSPSSSLCISPTATTHQLPSAEY